MIRATTALLAILLVIAMAGAAGQGGTTSATGAPWYYVALGDSLSIGSQPDGTGRAMPTDEGYADQLHARLIAGTPNLQLVKLGCGGETTATLREGGRCDYPHGSQLAEAAAFIETNRSSIALITISAGANDARTCTATEAIDPTCAATVLEAAPRNLAAAVAVLRAAAGPDVPIVGMTTYNTLLSAWLEGPAGEACARQTAPLVALYNGALTTAYTSAGAAVADVAAAFASDDFTTLVEVPGLGSVPLNVARLCQWTWQCAPPPFGPDIHANAAGYRVIADVIAATLAAARPANISANGPSGSPR